MSETVEKADKLIKLVRKRQKILYQLAFISTSLNPASEEAKKILEEMIKEGIVSYKEVNKALEDVKKWRERFLDHVFQ